MAKTFYSLIKSILLEHNCSFVRQGKGSHEIWQSPINNKRFSVPFTIKAKPTANAILRQAGIDKHI